MIEQLRSAGDQLRTALDNYCRVYSSIHNYPTLSTPPHAPKFPPEFTHQLDVELAFISCYEPKIQEIRLGISRARNYWSGVAPINLLPPDILTRVFHFLRPQPCNLHRLDFRDQYDYLYPDYLTRVCTLWRKVAISTRALWSHIDLSPYEPSCDALVTRAGVHVARAGDIPLELHISQGPAVGHCRANCGYYNLYELISRISNRTESLEFVISGDFRGLHRSVLSRLLLNHPPKLTKLMLFSETGHYDAFIYAEDIDPGDSDEEFEDFRLDLTEDQIENGFAPLTVLHLQGIFPFWSSIAYRGLVDLRLLSSDSWSSIGEEDFIAVLGSSPGLRILHFGLEIDNSTTSTEEITRVHLRDLQVVKIFPLKGGTTLLCPSRVLRLLAPGEEPLRLCFDNYYESVTTFTAEFEGFFARSRVARFYTRGGFLPMSTLLRHATHLDQVILEDFEPSMFEIPPSWLQVDELTSLPRLTSLYATTSALSEGELHLLVKCCPVGIVLHSCDVELDGSEESMCDDFADIFPTIRVTDTPLSSQDDLTDDWDILD